MSTINKLYFLAGNKVNADTINFESVSLRNNNALSFRAVFPSVSQYEGRCLNISFSNKLGVVGGIGETWYFFLTVLFLHTRTWLSTQK